MELSTTTIFGDLGGLGNFTITVTGLCSCDDVDFDECAVNNGGCSSDATCTNTPGSFTCTCLPGYSGDGFTCEGKSDYHTRWYCAEVHVGPSYCLWMLLMDTAGQLRESTVTCGIILDLDLDSTRIQVDALGHTPTPF